MRTPERKGPVIRYGILQAGYWIDYLIIASFAALFLSGRGFSTAQIGVVTSVSSLISCLLAQVSGTLADRYEKVPLKYFLILFFGICVLSFLGLAFLPHSYLSTMVFYITALSIQAAVSPLLNSLCLQFTNRGYRINFGLARSMGSFGYAASALVMGKVTDAFGAEIIVPIYLAVYAVVLLILLFFPVPAADGNENIVAGDNLIAEKPSTAKEFVHRYKRFLFLMVGLIFLWFLNSLLSTYMIYFIRDLGGSASAMGLSLSVMAFSEIPAVLFGNNIMARIGADQMLRISAFGGILKAFLFFIAPNVTFWVWLNVTHFFLSGFYQVSVVYYCYSIVGEKDVVKGQAILGIAVSGICAMLANFLGGIMLESLPHKLILLIGVICNVIAFVIIWYATDPKHFPDEKIRRL